MGRQLLKSICNIVVLIAAVIEYQAIHTSASGNRTASFALPDVVLPNITDTDSSVASARNATTVAVTERVHTASKHEETPPGTQATRHKPTTTVTSAHHESTTTVPHETPTTTAPKHTHPSREQHTTINEQTTNSPISPHSIKISGKPGPHPSTSSSSHSTDRSHSSTHNDSVSTSKTIFEKYSWWKIVVTLVIFCAMAGIILWILKLTESSKCKKGNGKDQSDIEDSSDTLSEKISTSRV